MQYYESRVNDIQVIALSSTGLAICWQIELDDSNTFSRIVPSFALADGSLCSSEARSEQSFQIPGAPW